MMIKFNASENPRPYTGDNHVLPKYRSKCDSCVQLPDSTPRPESDWILAEGFWDDDGFWHDDEFWED